ncbi:MOSC domain-containing protein [Agrobacterium rosae]|uniref:MOSC domain-containing protein n=1 Tax=Agrobacterium rosae TaxID=1972867 RepID=A0AAE5RXV3_9HYPH|nr:MOSC domain-containing protein [Agrobacterium rosae]KAA3514660.1 MOSC domain-containing protein [Agrobacterium rosae]KAA3523328.1 MOSC domain-containing protein [Agrobacterium rosae]MCM2433524.1 MOSC domain-containing protein [Agrobacterium rosae]MDX8329922.1 MOSC domain-containing protein [Agrobacterium rosae]MQB47883.1 MOSC domain-containing protein [Agrobacterium rosae]
MRITELNIYPLKSARGISLTESPISAEGLPGDRRAMLVDPSGQFITQRELPQIATINVRAEQNGFHLSVDGKGQVNAEPSNARIHATVWKSVVDAAVATDEVNSTLSGWLGRDVKLAFFDAQSRRSASVEWTGNDTPVTFADGYQILVTTTASLAALNENMAANGEDHVGMERFRPNIVLETDEPWAEDRWAALEINGIRFDLVKPCARCIMTTQDQTTGSRDVPSPMKAMGRLRMSADRRVPGPLFGWNVTPRGEGSIAVGDMARVVEERVEGWAFKRR